MEKLRLTSKELRHHLLQVEFRSALYGLETKVPGDTEAVMVLSAAPVKNEQGQVIDEASPENKARVDLAVNVVLALTAAKLHKSLAELTLHEVAESAPTLILNGETEQLPMLLQLTLEWDFPTHKIKLVNSGDRGKSNTKTQFEVLKKNPDFTTLKQVVLITNDYHQPRVARTAQTGLSPLTNFTVLGVPRLANPYSVFSVVKGEVKRILAYSAKGDIAQTLKKNPSKF